jgi:predicted secreted protein
MATSGIINGTKFGIYDGSTLIAYATSGSVSINHNARESSNKESAGWKEIMEGQRDWEVSCEGMVAFLTLAAGAVGGKTVDELFTSYIATRASLTVSFESSESGDKMWSGTAYMSSISMDAPNEESTTYSVSFTGTSTLTQATV